MFRVSKVEEPSHTTVYVDGQLSVENLEAVENSCDEAIARGKPVRIFLRDVPAVGAAGCDMLRRLIARGVHLSGTGVYTSYLISRLKAEPRTSKPGEPLREPPQG